MELAIAASDLNGHEEPHSLAYAAVVFRPYFFKTVRMSLHRKENVAARILITKTIIIVFSK